jgi:hypothetical protein
LNCPRPNPSALVGPVAVADADAGRRDPMLELKI